jgi:hypothetical protein
MNYEQKYLKYKQKYLELKNQLGGSFYFSVYVFSKNELDEERKNNMVKLLTSLYDGDINIVTDISNSPMGGYYWGEAVRYIDDKSNNISYYKNLTHVTSFVINNVPDELTSGSMNDAKLSHEEHKINNQLNNFNLNTISVPDIRGGLDNSFSRGWGFQSYGLALITLVENQ